MALPTPAIPDPVAELVAQVRAAKLAKLPPPARRRRIREDAGLSARAVARTLGVDVNTVLRWEQGVTTPTLEHAVPYRAMLDALEEAIS